MSGAALAWVRRIGTAPTLRLVAFALASRANDAAECWPSIATLVLDTGLGERAVQGALRRLSEMGLVLIDRPAGRASRYRLQLDRVAPVEETPAAGAPPQEMHPRRRCTPAAGAGVQDMRPTPAGDAPPPPQEMRGNKQRRNQEEVSGKKADRPAGPAKPPSQGALILSIAGGGVPVDPEQPLGERVRAQQSGEARRILKMLDPRITEVRMGSLLGAWCKHFANDRAVLLHTLRDAERDAAAERIVGDPVKWIWGLVRSRAANPPGVHSHGQSRPGPHQRPSGAGGTATVRAGVLDAFPELADRVEGG